MLQRTRTKTGTMILSSKDGAGYVPNWGGIPLKRADSEVQTNQRFFPQRWQSPLLSWTNYYIPWDRATLYQWIRLSNNRIKTREIAGNPYQL